MRICPYEINFRNLFLSLSHMFDWSAIKSFPPLTTSLARKANQLSIYVKSLVLEFRTIKHLNSHPWRRLSKRSGNGAHVESRICLNESFQRLAWELGDKEQKNYLRLEPMILICNDIPTIPRRSWHVFLQKYANALEPDGLNAWRAIWELIIEKI